MADEIEGISRIGSVEKKAMHAIDKVAPEKLTPDQLANQDHFEQLMTQERKKEDLQAQAQSETKQSNLIDEVRNLHTKVDRWGSTASPEDLVAQAQEAITKIEEIKGQLATPDLTIKPPVQNMLQRKLTHIDENLKIALDRAGLEYNEIKPAEREGIPNPIERFLGMLTDSQHKLETINNDVGALNREQINPADLLAVQVKVNSVQQEVEFFSNLLNKALESTKTLMNVQV